ncbi:MAG: VWA domain-containing protein [Bdellovibrionaceae bacterium]|nr:VWA domain-containing protein [Pseudobdellovibrionaceae bacterium]
MKTSSLHGLAFCLILAACSPESSTMTITPDVVIPPAPKGNKVIVPESVWVTEDGGQKQMEFNPQVDILFVIDNSDSMKSAQANLIRSIDRFAERIVKNNVDYHIGVVSTWDSSERFLKAKQDSYQMGDLRFLKDESGQQFDRRYFTPKDHSSLLASTLKIGVASYTDGGPEVEEFFSPLLASMEKVGRGAANEGFFRADSRLVVVFLTDADDSTSQTTPEQVASKLVEFKGGMPEKVSVYGVITRKDDPDEYKDWALRVHPKYHPECFTSKGKSVKLNEKCSDGFGPERLEQLIVLANNESLSPDEKLKKFSMSISSKNFGSDLASIGADINEKTLQKVIRLTGLLPRLDKTGFPMIRVRYGSPEELAVGKGEIIPPSKKGGWQYDADNNAIHLAGDIKAYEHSKPGYRFAVDYSPVTLAE